MEMEPEQCEPNNENEPKIRDDHKKIEDQSIHVVFKPKHKVISEYPLLLILHFIIHAYQC